MRRLNVVVSVNAAWNIWNFRRPVIEHLLAEGHRVTVLAPPDDSTADLEALGCRFVPLRMDVKGFNPLADARLTLRLWRHFRRLKPDVILSYTIKNNIFGAFAAKALGIPFLPNVSGLGTAFLSGRMVQTVAETLYRRAFARLPVVFFQNGDDRALFTGRCLLRAEQARLLPGSGIDLTRFAPAPYPAETEAPVFLMIARLLRDKGTVEFIEAARRVKAEMPGARFQLLGPIGTGNRTAIDRAQVEAWVAEGVVDYLGTTNDVRPCIAAAACVVLPSYREGAPRTLIEAAAMARPLIATDVPGCRAVVDRDATGYLCEVKNAESLAEAMRRFLALSGEARAAMGWAGRAKMEREYDQAIVVAAYREAISAVTGRAQDATPRATAPASGIRHMRADL